MRLDHLPEAGTDRFMTACGKTGTLEYLGSGWATVEYDAPRSGDRTVTLTRMDKKTCREVARTVTFAARRERESISLATEVEPLLPPSSRYAGAGAFSSAGLVTEWRARA